MEQKHKKITISAYRASKQQLIELESSNYNSILVIPCSGNQGWQELAEHSALIYYYVVCQKLNRRARFFSDEYNSYEHYKIGYMHARDLDSIRINLKRARLYSSEDSINLIHVFKLNTTFTKEEIIEYYKQEKIRRTNNLTPLQPANLDPELHQLLVSCSSRLHRVCNSRLDRLACNTNGIRIIRLSDTILSRYHSLVFYPPNDSRRLTAELTKMRAHLYELLIEIQILGETKLWDFELVMSLSDNIIKARDIVERHLKNLSKENPGTINPKPVSLS